MLFVGLMVIVLGLAAYLGAAYLVYDEVSSTKDPNAGRYDAINPGNLVFTDAAGTHDFSRFESDDYTDVRFPSRQDGIAIAAWYFTGRALKLVEAIRTEAEEITGTTIQSRVPEPDNDDEVEA